MAKLSLGGMLNAQLTATSIDRHPESEKAVIVTFKNGEKALASISKHFSGNDPKFLDGDNNLLPQYAVKSIDGTRWIVDANAKGGLAMPK